MNEQQLTDKPQDSTGNDLILIKTSGVHGTGGFARRAIPAGTRIIEYVGEKIDKAESLKRCELNNEYIFTIDETHDLDGNVDWNPARFINHSCAPNCEAEWDECRIWIVAMRDIAPGEELNFNYGYDLEDFQEHPCRCGAAHCVGYIVAEEYFEDIRRKAETGAAVKLI
jgi:SET domain-containing protein